MKVIPYLFIAFLSIFAMCEQARHSTAQAWPEQSGKMVEVKEKMNGLTFVAPPEPFEQNPFDHIVDVGANWIAVVPYAFTRIGTPVVHYNSHGNQWWGEKPEGVAESVRLAHLHGIKVMLKPQVYVPNGWTGALDFDTPEACAAWETSYEQYIVPMAQMADTLGIEMLCIGTEFGKLIQKRPQFWHDLIVKIKTVYKGKLTYSSNWDDWERVPFWGQLDYVGLGGYFPLIEDTLPPVNKLVTAWQPIAERLENFSQKSGKPILFTEFGYLSVDGCGWRNWELESNIDSRSINEQAQANCYEALFTVFKAKPWWGGCFLWKWFPNMRGHEGYPERDYTPQGKLGEKALQKWYKQ